MAGDWIKLKSNLDTSIKTYRIAAAINETVPQTVFHLYRMCGWLATHSHYGKFSHPASSIDLFLGIPGFSAALFNVEWLQDHKGIITVSVELCAISATRKSLGKKVRKEILSTGKCAICGQASPLVIDHKTPIVRGGSCETKNLHAVCAPCNRAKGRKTMREFLQARRGVH